MKKLTVYTVYVDDGFSAMRIVCPAESEKAAREYTAGNGEIVAIRKNDLQDINLNALHNSLVATGWGRDEIDVIIRALHHVVASCISLATTFYAMHQKSSRAHSAAPPSKSSPELSLWWLYRLTDAACPLRVLRGARFGLKRL